MGKVTHGVQSFGYALIDTTGENPTFKTPVMMKGIRQMTTEVEQATTKVFADNGVHCMLLGQKVRSAEATVYSLPDSYLTDCLGFVLNANGSITDTGTKVSHCIFWESIEEDCETNLSTRTIHYIYNVLATEPSKEYVTDEDEATPQEIAIPYEAKASEIAVDDKGVPTQYMELTRTETNSTLYDTFKTSVILPTDAI